MKAKLMVCLVALSVAVAGYISCVIASYIDWTFGFIKAPAILPGLSFGLAMAGWLLFRRSIGRWKAVGLVFGSTVAYLVAYWIAFFTVTLCGKGMLFLVTVRMALFYAGMIGGLVGTALLSVSLAAVSADFRRKHWKTLILIGAAAGGALCLAGMGTGSGPGSLANPGDRTFIVVWQLVVSGYVGMLLLAAPSVPEPAQRGPIALWARRAVFALLLVSFAQGAIGYSRGEKKPAPSSDADAQPSTPGRGDVAAWANSYRNAKFITRAEFVRRVGPVRLVLMERGVNEYVPSLDSIVRTSAAKHGLTIASQPTDVELVVEAELDRSKITTTEYSEWGANETGYHMAYTAFIKARFFTKANCYRGNKFVQLDVSPCGGQNMYYGYMGDLVDFNAAYENAFHQAADVAFENATKFGDSDDTDDATAWIASLWPATQNAEMQKNFLSPITADAGGSNHAFYGVIKFGFGNILLSTDASKEFNAASIEQSWRGELSRNRQEVDRSSDIQIYHVIEINNLSRGLLGGVMCYYDESDITVAQANVVFKFGGELRRATARIWNDRESAIALPRDNGNTVHEVVDRSIRSAAKELALRR